MMARIKKFNNGKGAILCNGCHVIVKQGNGITQEEVPKARVRVYGEIYIVDPNQEDLAEGDLVLDRGDGLYGVIDHIMPSQNSLHGPNIELQAAVRDGIGRAPASSTATQTNGQSNGGKLMKWYIFNNSLVERLI